MIFEIITYIDQLRSIFSSLLYFQDNYSGTWSRRECTSAFKPFYWLYHIRNPGNLNRHGETHSVDMLIILCIRMYYIYFHDIYVFMHARGYFAVKKFDWSLHPFYCLKHSFSVIFRSGVMYLRKGITEQI